MKKWEMYSIIKNNMQLPFDYAIWKCVSACKKEGNTVTPWNDFSIEHLEKRLQDEIKEYFESHKSDELLDIINLASFIWLANLNKKVEILFPDKKK